MDEDGSHELLNFVFPQRQALVVRTSTADDGEPSETEADAPMCVHELVEYITWHRKAGFTCDGCEAKFGQGVTLYGCRICDFDLCPKCHFIMDSVDDRPKHRIIESESEQAFLKIVRIAGVSHDAVAAKLLDAMVAHDQSPMVKSEGTKLHVDSRNAELCRAWTCCLLERERLSGDTWEVAVDLLSLMLTETAAAKQSKAAASAAAAAAPSKRAGILLDGLASAQLVSEVPCTATQQALTLLRSEVARGPRPGRCIELWVDIARQFRVATIEASAWLFCRNQLFRSHRWQDSLQSCQAVAKMGASDSSMAELLRTLLSHGHRYHEQLPALVPRMDAASQAEAVSLLTEAGFPQIADRIRRLCDLGPRSADLQRAWQLDLLKHLVQMGLLARAEQLAQTVNLRSTDFDAQDGDQERDVCTQLDQSLLADYPLFSINGDAIRLVDNPAAAECFAAAVHSGLSVAGVDCEWPPGEAGISICQVALGQEVWIVDILWATKAESGGATALEALRLLLSTPEIRKVGFGFHEDFDRLIAVLSGADSGVDWEARNVVDLQQDHRGLAALFLSETGQVLDKSLQCSAWGARPLSHDQLCYAATDSLCLLRLHEALAGRASAPRDLRPRPRAPCLAQAGTAEDVLSEEAPLTVDNVRRTISEAGLNAQFVSPAEGIDGTAQEIEPCNVVCFLVKPEKRAVAVVTPSKARVSAVTLATMLKCSRRNVMMATSTDCVRRFGFRPGAIPPLGFRAGVEVLLSAKLRVLDDRLLSFSAGDGQTSLLITSTAVASLGRWLPEEASSDGTELATVMAAMSRGELPLHFVCDSMLGRLAHKLRALDCDTVLIDSASQLEKGSKRTAAQKHPGEQRREEHHLLLQAAQSGKVVVLTNASSTSSSTGSRRRFTLQGAVYWLRGTSIEDHLREVCCVFGIDALARAQAPLDRRCWDCNGSLTRIPNNSNNSIPQRLDVIRHRVSRTTLEVYDVFFLCQNASCQKVFWHGSTYADEMRNIERMVCDPCFRFPPESVSAAQSEPAVKPEFVSAECLSGRALRVIDLPSEGARCHSDRGYIFKSLGGFASLESSSRVRYLLTPDGDKCTPPSGVMWRLRLRSPAAIYLNFKSQRHVHIPVVLDWLSAAGWSPSVLASTVTTGVPDGLYSGPVYWRMCQPGDVDLPGSGTPEGVYLVFVVEGAVSTALPF